MITRTEVVSFRDEVARRLGLHFDDDRFEDLARTLEARCREARVEPGDYLRALASDGAGGREELRVLAGKLTVNETYFFRHREQLRAFVETALPDRLRARQGGRPVAIRSAGCASGEEPYTLVMLVRDHFPGLEPGRDFTVGALDISRSMLDKAARALYSPWSLRDTPAASKQRYFQVADGGFLLDRTVREAVRFEEKNLGDDDPAVWRPGSLDIVFCRNVLMYLAPELVRAIVARIAAALRPGGYFFMGHAETLRGVSNEFHLCHTEGAFYYQRRPEGDVQRPVEWTPVPAPASSDPLPVPAPGGFSAPASAPDDAWVSVIQGASARIASLTGGAGSGAGAAPPAAPSPPPVVGSAGRPFDAALALVREERFDAALAHLRAASPEHTSDPEAALLSAVLLLNSGQAAEAERVCAELLARDELNPGAHYVLALCREQRGDARRAVEHHQVASYLDPSFAMPRLRLGILARRSGQLDSARRELDEAQRLLAREDSARILLFAGGFSREALLQVCSAEQRACGGRW